MFYIAINFNPLGTETSTNTNDETSQTGMSVSSTEVVSTDTLVE